MARGIERCVTFDTTLGLLDSESARQVLYAYKTAYDALQRGVPESLRQPWDSLSVEEQRKFVLLLVQAQGENTFLLNFSWSSFDECLQ